MNKTNIWIDKYLKDLEQNKFNLKKEGLFLGNIKNLTETLIKELKDTYNEKNN